MVKSINKTWGGVLMMGGRGQRMGGVDKSTLELKGRSFRNIAMSNLTHTFHNVAISTGPQNNPDIQCTQFTDIEVHGEFIGPSGGILAGLKWAESLGLKGIVTLPVDTPLLPDNLCETLCASGQACYAQKNEQPHWLHAAWPLSTLSVLRRSVLEKRIYSLRGLHAAIGSTPVVFETLRDEDFVNINTQQALEDLTKNF